MIDIARDAISVFVDIQNVEMFKTEPKINSKYPSVRNLKKLFQKYKEIILPKYFFNIELQ